MSSIFTDKQRDSLMESMINPESNARKMIEQNQEIGISPDITTEILNKYATYGANTGIGELGGGKLVDALNEEYRKAVDAPLREMSEKANVGGQPETLEDFDQLYRLFQNRYIDTDTESKIDTPSGSAERALTKTQLLQSGGFDPRDKLEAYNLPVGLRKWFVDRLVKQLEAEKEAIEKASKGGGSNSQTLTPLNEPTGPQKLY